MEKKLDVGSFTNIFKDGLPNTINNLPEKSFNFCINDFSLPYLSEEEKNCIEFLCLHLWWICFLCNMIKTMDIWIP